MKVLMVTREFPPYGVGGIATHTFYLCNALGKKGVDVRVIAFGDPRSSNDKITFVRPGSSIISRSTESLGRDLAVLFDIARFTKIVNRLLHEEDFDIVHVQEPYVGGFVRAKAKVTTIHDTSYGELASIAPERFGFREIEKSLFYIGIGFLMEYASIVSSQSVITPAPNIRDQLRQKYLVGAGKLLVIMNGANLNRYTSISRNEAKKLLGIDPSVILIFTSGRHVSRKRLDVLLRALSLFKGNELFENLEVRIAGDGPLRPYLENLCINLGISAHVTFVGWLSQDALELHYKASDVFVTCSEYEASPIAILEAMIAGSSVISTRIYAFPAPAMAENGKEILLVPTGDNLALTNAIELLARDRKLRDKLSSHGYTFALQHTWQDNALKTLHLYRSVLHCTSSTS